MKSSYTNELSLSQFERRFESLRLLKDKAAVREGWIKFMRQALGLTLNDLAKLVSLSRISIVKAEQREIEGKVTLSTLKKMAEAMDCDFIYSFVPKKDLKSIIHDQAILKATEILKSADHHMKLESQGVEGDKQERIERLARSLIEKGDIW
jgi:predicted DNA-binding mobile mystery protein A